METTTMLGKEIRKIWLFRSKGVHPAWVDEFTLPIVSQNGAFLELSDGSLIKVDPCEVTVSPDRYPSLGLVLKPCAHEALSLVAPGGRPWNAVQLEEAEAILPFSISDIEESDVLGEDTVNQFVFTTSNGWRITFRHIFPPMMLGISLESTGGAPNKSLKADAVHGAA
jgi:hypothetical protein